jgi:hypothetical protein
MEDTTQEPKPAKKTSPLVLGLTLLLVAALPLIGIFLFQPSEEELTDIQGALDKGALLVDVRTPGEFGSGHLRGAVNVPVDQLHAKLGELGAKDAPLVVY